MPLDHQTKRKGLSQNAGIAIYQFYVYPVRVQKFLVGKRKVVEQKRRNFDGGRGLCRENVKGEDL